MLDSTISRYKVLEKLGEGGMGVVYKAKDPRLGRYVALKFLPPDLLANEKAKQRLLSEARAASALDHPNICTVHDIGETEDGRLFFAMAYYKGCTLAERIEQGPLSMDEALTVVSQVARGLSHAHDARVIHRDIKPSNILMTERGDVKILATSAWANAAPRSLRIQAHALGRSPISAVRGKVAPSDGKSRPLNVLWPVLPGNDLKSRPQMVA